MQSVHSWPVMSCENFEQGVDMGLTYLHSLYMRLIVDILLLILLRTRSWSLTKGHRGRLLFRWETCLWTWNLAVQMNTCKIGILSFGKFFEVRSQNIYKKVNVKRALPGELAIIRNT